MPTRRTVLQQALLTAGLAAAQPLRALALTADTSLTIANVTRLYDVRVARIATPQSTADVTQAVSGWPGKVSVGGGRYSMGGQVAIDGGLHLDMRGLNRLVWLDPAAKRARVQAGMRWRDLQDLIDPHNLAVKTMQSYANFTVGGAVSVNAHGRYVGHGPVGGSVRALQLVMADGRVVEASRQQNPELFRAAVGGYGALAAITEVELDLVDNTRIEREVHAVPLTGYVDFFNRQVRGDARAVMHNADLMPPLFDAPVAITWRRSDKAATEPERLQPRDRSYALERGVIWAMTELPGGGTLRRAVVQPLRLGGESSGATARPAWTWPSSNPARAFVPPTCCRSTSSRRATSWPTPARWRRCSTRPAPTCSTCPSATRRRMPMPCCPGRAKRSSPSSSTTSRAPASPPAAPWATGRAA